MHLGENLFFLATNTHADFIAEGLKVVHHGAEILVGLREIRNHHHVEEAIDDGLGDIEHVDMVLCKIGANARDGGIQTIRGLRGRCRL